MSENNHDEATALFATKRKKIQEEEAQKAAQKAEAERMAELENQKRQVADEIKRLEALKAEQKAQEEKRAQEEQMALEAQRVLEEQKNQKREDARAAAKAGKSGGFDIKKYLPLICIGAAVILAVVIILIIVLGKKGNKISEFLSVDSSTGFFKMDTSLFGLSYDEFKKKIEFDDLGALEEWPWWAPNMEVVYVEDKGESFACIFQNKRLVSVHRDADSPDAGKMYDGAVAAYGVYDLDSDYWTGYKQYLWDLDKCAYMQFVEKYDDNDPGHYRQQYASYDIEGAEEE